MSYPLSRLCAHPPSQTATTPELPFVRVKPTHRRATHQPTEQAKQANKRFDKNRTNTAHSRRIGCVARAALKSCRTHNLTFYQSFCFVPLTVLIVALPQALHIRPAAPFGACDGRQSLYTFSENGRGFFKQLPHRSVHGRLGSRVSPRLEADDGVARFEDSRKARIDAAPGRGGAPQGLLQ